MDSGTKFQREVITSRWLMVVAITLYPAWSLFYHHLYPGAVDPIGQRLAVAGIVATTLALSFVPGFARRIRWLMAPAYILIAGHFFWLVHLNALSPEYMVGAYITLMSVDVAINSLEFLLGFSIFVVAAAVALTAAHPTPDGFFFALGMATIQLVAALSLRMRLGVEASLLQAQAVLNRTEQRLVEAQRIAHLGSWEWDVRTGRMIWSDEFYELLGLLPGAVSAGEAALLARVHPGDRPLVEGALAAALARREPFALDARIVLPDGRERDFHIRGQVVEADGGPRGVGAALDVTERKRADRYKDEFLSVISHELRTPLNFITGFGSILDDELDGPLNPRQHEYLAKILQGAERMLGLVDNLLDMGRMQAGKFRIDPQPVALGALVDEVAATLGPLAEEKRIALVAKVDEVGEISCDPRRIVQVLSNLVGNAIKFTPHGGRITVRGRVAEGCAIVEVADTGPGISADDLPRLFQRFSQLDMSSTRPAGGTGLGLSISKALIEAHGGSIGVKSTPGEGCTFWFALPCRAGEPARSASRA